MRRNNHWYQVILVVEDRDDVDSNWNITEHTIYEGKNRDKAIWFMWNHAHLETQLDSNDDGSSWTHIQTLRLRRVR